MKRLAAFALGVAVVVAAQVSGQRSPGDPLPDRSQVQESILRLEREARGVQRAAFADGRIDPTEYREAVFARIACLRSTAGVPVEIVGPAPIAGGRILTWHYRVADWDGRATEADRRCSTELSGSIERAWKLQVVPQGPARRKEVAELAACLRRAGVPLRGDDVRSVLVGAVGAAVPVGACVDEHAVLFDL